MKIIGVSIFGLIFLFFPYISLGAVFSLQPASGKYVVGQTLSLSVFVNPEGTRLYTVKVDLNYPAELLEAEGFVFGENWLRLNQPGYDLINNNQGLLVKTGGFPGGVSSPLALGTASFSVKKAGAAVVTVGSDSLLLDRESKNLFSGPYSQAVFNLGEKAVVKPAATKSALIAEPKSSPAATPAATPVVQKSLEIEPTNQEKFLKYGQLTLLAGLAFVLEQKTILYLVLALVAIVAFKVLLFLLRFLKR